MGVIEIGEGSVIDPTATLYATERLVIGAGAKIGAGCVIEGRDIQIGREFYMGAHSTIGGGSKFERHSSLNVGHFFHMGEGSFVNTARPVTIGNEVGLGMGTKIFTHGAYLSPLDGFPVSFAPVIIGNRVWLPGAIVNPGVIIGNNVVVGVNSLVTKNLPSGCMAAGSPAKVIKEKVYPNKALNDKAFWAVFIRDYPDKEDAHRIVTYDDVIRIDDTEFICSIKVIRGPVTDRTERLRDILRRYGIRFICSPENGKYVIWE